MARTPQNAGAKMRHQTSQTVHLEPPDLVSTAYSAVMRRARILWWILFGMVSAGWLAVGIAIYLLDWEPPDLLFAAMALCGMALGIWRELLRNRSKSRRTNHRPPSSEGFNSNPQSRPD